MTGAGEVSRRKGSTMLIGKPPDNHVVQSSRGAVPHDAMNCWKRTVTALKFAPHHSMSLTTYLPCIAGLVGSWAATSGGISATARSLDSVYVVSVIQFTAA